MMAPTPLLKKKNQKYGKSTEVTASLLTVQPTSHPEARWASTELCRNKHLQRLGIQEK